MDDADFQATEARWAVERAAARERFTRAAGYLARLAEPLRAAELDRFEALHGAIARREMEGFLHYRETLQRGVQYRCMTLERQVMHSHAEHGNDHQLILSIPRYLLSTILYFLNSHEYLEPLFLAGLE